MTPILARFKRGEDRVKIVPNMDPGYHYIITNPAQGPTRVERFQSGYLALHLEMYQRAGYERLSLCRACKGSGQQWWTDSRGDADRDICTVCQGEGGFPCHPVTTTTT